MAWVGQRECANCGFAGPETEFGAVGMIDDAVFFVHLDQGGTGNDVTVCKGCVADMQQWSYDLLSGGVREMLGAA